VSKELDPGALMEGLLLKRGLVRVSEVEAARPGTLLLRWGVSGKRNLALGLGYAQEVSIALVDARSLEAVFSCTGEGIGDTEVDDIRDAIAACLSSMN